MEKKIKSGFEKKRKQISKKITSMIEESVIQKR
jgi:hypothetical protein